MTKLLALLAVVACSKSDEAQPAASPHATPKGPSTADPAPTPTAPAAADPWAEAPAAPDDPWRAKDEPTAAEPPIPAAAAEPTPPQPTPQRPPESGGASSVAGSYQCQQLRYGTNPGGVRQSTYVSSALGVFEIGVDGAYRSASYSAKGTGHTRLDASTVTFEGGAYAGSRGLAGTTASGSFYIRFSENLTDPPRPSMQFNDHMCYRN